MSVLLHQVGGQAFPPVRTDKNVCPPAPEVRTGGNACPPAVGCCRPSQEKSKQDPGGPGRLHLGLDNRDQSSSRRPRSRKRRTTSPTMTRAPMAKNQNEPMKSMSRLPF